MGPEDGLSTSAESRMLSTADNFSSNPQFQKQGVFGRECAVDEEEVEKPEERLQGEGVEVVIQNDLEEEEDVDDDDMYEP